MPGSVHYADDFCTEISDGTRAVHDESDKLINIKLIAALTDTRIYSQAVADFYFVFRQLETCLEKLKDDPRLGILYFCAQDEYRRTELFQKDLQYYLGSYWSRLVRPSKAAENYCKRLEEIEETRPILLIAYVHSMYLALLAGGSILKRVIKKTLGLSGEEGLALFGFGSGFVSRTEFRKKIKDAINCIELNQEEKDEILKEKILCFKMNNAIASNLPISFANYHRFLAIVSCIVLAACGVVGVIFSTFRGSA